MLIYADIIGSGDTETAGGRRRPTAGWRSSVHDEEVHATAVIIDCQLKGVTATARVPLRDQFAELSASVFERACFDEPAASFNVVECPELSQSLQHVRATRSVWIDAQALLARWHGMVAADV